MGERRQICTNEDHTGRPPAVAWLTWPDGRFRPEKACRSCLRRMVLDSVLGELGEGPRDVHVHPLGGNAQTILGSDVEAAKPRPDRETPAPAQAREPDCMPEPEGRGSPWPIAAANPAGEADAENGASPAGPPEDQPGSSQPSQWRVAHIIATRKNLSGSQVHEKASIICGRNITSLKECSYAEMQLILGQL